MIFFSFLILSSSSRFLLADDLYHLLAASFWNENMFGQSKASAFNIHNNSLNLEAKLSRKLYLIEIVADHSKNT